MFTGIQEKTMIILQGSMNLPSGPVRGGKAPSKEEIHTKVRQYYEEIGYDEKGIPREEILEKLGLGEAKRDVKRIRRRLGV